MLNSKMIRDGGNVVRFHTANMVKSQDVAQHSFNCALLVDMIASSIAFDVSINGSERHEMVIYMLLHDIPEQHIGDIPGPSKNGEYECAIAKEEHKWVEKSFEPRYKDVFNQIHMSYLQSFLCKFVDNLECLYKCQEECALGNSKFCSKVDIIKKSLTLDISSSYESGLLSYNQYDYLKQLIEKDGI